MFAILSPKYYASRLISVSGMFNDAPDLVPVISMEVSMVEKVNPEVAPVAPKPVGTTPV
tara:strand:- start:60 stop:236 length:177 start_codon:yes stop_codon:yes gene_type:complete